jgi:dihydroorotase
MEKLLIKEALVVNDGKVEEADVLIKNGRIEKIAPHISVPQALEYQANGHYLMPGVIDDQVHFREPGLTHKASIATESRAAVAGGVTSFMEMPNTNPPAFTQELLQQKYDIAAKTSIANYSFYMGTSNNNLDEILKTNGQDVCGIKIFMGSSTGNLLVDDIETLEKIFSSTPLLIATHCEDEATIQANTAKARQTFGDNIPMEQHPIIRSREACIKSSNLAISLAKKHGTQLHVLHLTTAEEAQTFAQQHVPNITAEVCMHHLWYSNADYNPKQGLIKCNPAIKTMGDREALWQSLMAGGIAVVATDHAPHTWAEKQAGYLQCPAGLPLIQYSLPMMLHMATNRNLPITWVAKMMSHAVADLFRIEDRGYIREGYYADLTLVAQQPVTIKRENILMKCGWSPLEGETLNHRVVSTWVNGQQVWDGQKVIEAGNGGMRLKFRR